MPAKPAERRDQRQKRQLGDCRSDRLPFDIRG
jgi:hypothetical protein